MGCMLLFMPFNMCTKRITILMQVNQNLWKVRYYLNFKDNHTWHHDSLTKVHFIKSTSVNYIIFYHFYKLHQISYAPTIENLWLPSMTLFRWSLIIWRSHQCVHGILDDFSHLYIHIMHIMNYLSKWHLGWIVEEVLYIPIFTPYDICKLARQELFSVVLPYTKENL
jgi:hypothetical protein